MPRQKKPPGTGEPAHGRLPIPLEFPEGISAKVVCLWWRLDQERAKHHPEGLARPKVTPEGPTSATLDQSSSSMTRSTGRRYSNSPRSEGRVIFCVHPLFTARKNCSIRHAPVPNGKKKTTNYLTPSFRSQSRQGPKSSSPPVSMNDCCSSRVRMISASGKAKRRAATPSAVTYGQSKTVKTSKLSMGCGSP